MSVRQEFEEWYLGLHGSTCDDLHTEPEGDIHMDKGDYYDLGARMMWQAYQAAHKAQQAEIERLKAELDEIKQEFGRLSYGLVHDEPEWQPSKYTDKAFSKLMDLTAQALEGNQ